MAAAQNDLFAAGSATSQKAAVANRPRRLTQRERVRLVIAEAGHHGLTRTEIAAATGLPENSVRPRVKELLDDDDSGIVVAKNLAATVTFEREGREVLREVKWNHLGMPPRKALEKPAPAVA